MTTELDERQRRPKVLTREVWVRFGEEQAELLKELAKARGMALAQVVRQAAIVHYNLPRESQDID